MEARPGRGVCQHAACSAPGDLRSAAAAAAPAASGSATADRIIDTDLSAARGFAAAAELNVGDVLQSARLLAKAEGIAQRKTDGGAIVEETVTDGEVRRVARVGEPRIVLADEPTGNLDSRTSVEVIALLQELGDSGITVVLVTHEHDIAEHATRVVEMRDGRVLSDVRQQRRRAAVPAPRPLRAETTP
jgi:ABC-type glutathione transport system ATPase component